MNRTLHEHEIETLVNYLKEEVGLGKDSLVPNIDAFIESTDYRYEEGEFHDSFSAASRSLGSGDYLILYNKNQNWSEKFRRFTLAHELGHLTLPSHRAMLNEQGIHFSTTEFSSDRIVEREADKFAINFLVPKSAFQTAMAPMGYTNTSIASLSDTFNISAYATAHRFVELAGKCACSLIACHENGTVKYEIRSDGMKNLVRGHRSLNSLPINSSTLASEFIRGVHDRVTVQLSLSEWYQDFGGEIEAMESIIDLGYNQLYLALIEPLSTDVANEDDELQIRLPSEKWNDPYEY
ncbi:MAG: ImmA/IrrE family metallo-endopeptidase [Planctomycetes bacterium]|nr:ImmA/IrrE family metallo-endopeptidase [Planctomycetota bacterium]